jgi:hypothetical protein
MFNHSVNIAGDSTGDKTLGRDARATDSLRLQTGKMSRTLEMEKNQPAWRREKTDVGV